MSSEKLKNYFVTFYYHTYGTIKVKARNKDEALKIASPDDLSNELLLSNLQEDDTSTVEEDI